MKHNRQTARDISYAYSARTYSGRAVIKILENITGRFEDVKPSIEKLFYRVMRSKSDN